MSGPASRTASVLSGFQGWCHYYHQTQYQQMERYDAAAAAVGRRTAGDCR